MSLNGETTTSNRSRQFVVAVNAVVMNESLLPLKNPIYINMWAVINIIIIMSTERSLKGIGMTMVRMRK